MLSSDDYTDTLSSPLAASSPYKQRNNTKGDIRANLRDTGVHFATTYSKRQYKETISKNCSNYFLQHLEQSCRSKRVHWEI